MEDDNKRVFYLNLADDDGESLDQSFVVTDGLLPDGFQEMVQGMVNSLLNKELKF